MSIVFQKATKTQLKARIALDGPSGAGKTWTGLTIASRLGERLCWIDSERRSASLYADHFEFDTFPFDPPYDPSRLVDVLRAAEAEGYDVIGIDSLSHFWEGEGGTLDIVDSAAQRSFNGNKYAGWSVGTPALRRLIDTMLGLDAHLVVSMRSKMDYVEEEDARGRKQYVKVGMAPVMRGGIEYEFTLVGDLDIEHRLVVSKSRCTAVADKVYVPGAAGDLANEFRAWLESGEPMVTRDQVAKLREILDSIDAGKESDRRQVAKRTWKDCFGDPQALVASKFGEALAFAEELAAVVTDPSALVAETQDPGPGPEAVTDEDPAEPESATVPAAARSCPHGVDPNEDFCVACNPDTAPPPRSRTNGRRPSRAGATT